jgi:hypothetical protein
MTEGVGGAEEGGLGGEGLRHQSSSDQSTHLSDRLRLLGVGNTKLGPATASCPISLVPGIRMELEEIIGTPAGHDDFGEGGGMESRRGVGFGDGRPKGEGWELLAGIMECRNARRCPIDEPSPPSAVPRPRGADC